MGSKGSNKVETSQTQTYTPNPAVGQAGTQAVNMATAAANQPFQQPIAPVAGLTPDQLAAFQTVRNAQGIANPYFTSAANYANASAAPITEADIQNYYNPYAKSIFDNLAETFGQQNRNVTGQLTQAAGGVGADRIAVGQSELARQQGLTAGQTAASIYQSALAAAQNEKQRQAQGAFALGSLGPAAQAAQLQGAGAQLNVGGLQQQQSQAELNAPYQNTLARLAYPFQTAQYLAGVTGGVAPALGGTTAGQSTQVSTPAQPSALSQILGAGLGIAGTVMGGPLGGSIGSGLGSLIGGGGGKGSGTAGFGGTSPMSMSGGYSSALNAPSYPNPYGGSWYGNRGGRVPRDAGGAVDDVVPTIEMKPGPYPQPMQMAAPGGGGGGASGGSGGSDLSNIASAAMKILPMLLAQKGGRILRHASGGAVNPFSIGQGFADGGAPDPGSPSAFINDRFMDIPQAPAANASPFPVLNGDAIGPGKPMAWDATPVAAPRGVVPPAPPAAAPSRTFGRQPFAVQQPMQPNPQDDGTDAVEEAPAADRAATPPRSPWEALAAAGFGMMAGTSPFAGVNIGKGALEGLKVLEQQRQHGAQDRRVDLEAKRLMQQADQFMKSHGLRERQLQESIRQHDITQMQPVKIGTDELGRDVYARKDQATGQYIRIDPKTGQQWQEPEVTPKVEGAPAAAPAAVQTAAAPVPEEAALPPGAKPVAGDAPAGVRQDFLDKLPPESANLVKGISEGRIPVTAIPQKQRQAVLNLVTQYDPSFDAVNYNARARTRANFASTGVEGRNITALNTVLGHINTLDKKGAALDNWKTDDWGPATKTFNEARKWVLEHKQDPRVKEFDAAADAVSNELEKAFRGSQTAISGIKSWRALMHAGMSPEEMRETNKTLAQLLGSRIEAMGKAYNSGMGTTKDPMTFLSPEAQQTFDRLMTGKKTGGERPKPTQADIDYARAHPEVRGKFIQRFGVEP